MAVIQIGGVGLDGVYSATLYQQIGDNPNPTQDMYLSSLTVDNEFHDLPMEDGKYWVITGLATPPEEPTE